MAKKKGLSPTKIDQAMAAVRETLQGLINTTFQIQRKWGHKLYQVVGEEEEAKTIAKAITWYLTFEPDGKYRIHKYSPKGVEEKRTICVAFLFKEDRMEKFDEDQTFYVKVGKNLTKAFKRSIAAN